MLAQKMASFALLADRRNAYDPFSRLETVSVVRRFGGQLTSPEGTTYGYDRAGNLHWTDLPGAMAIDYVIDDQQRLIDEVYFLDSDVDHLLDWSDLNGDGIYSTSEGERPFHRFITTRDIQGRRASSLETSYSTIGSTIEEYRWTYDEAGRLSKEDYTQRLLGTGQGTQQASTNTRYLVDPQSPTGYAEVFESTDAGGNRLHYTLGHTIIGQTGGKSCSSGPTQLYVTDALGSVRQVISSTATQTYYAESGVSYDAFGNKSNSNLTLLNVAIGYAGQMFDQGRNSQGSVTGQIYSRARYYQPGTGTFTTLDPYLGNPQNPLSLHKYLYVHADPVNATDPSGMFSIGASFGSASISAALGGLSNAAAAVKGAALDQVALAGLRGAAIGFASGFGGAVFQTIGYSRFVVGVGIGAFEGAAEEYLSGGENILQAALFGGIFGGVLARSGQDSSIRSLGVSSTKSKPTSSRFFTASI